MFWVPEHSVVMETLGPEEKSLKFTKQLDWVPEKWEEIVAMIKMEREEWGER